jgi:hypothetical protein
VDTEQTLQGEYKALKILEKKGEIPKLREKPPEFKTEEEENEEPYLHLTISTSRVP